MRKYTSFTKDELEKMMALQKKHGLSIPSPNERRELAKEIGRPGRSIDQKLYLIRKEWERHIVTKHAQDPTFEEKLVELLRGKTVWADMNPDKSGVIHMSFRRLEIDEENKRMRLEL